MSDAVETSSFSEEEEPSPDPDGLSEASAESVSTEEVCAEAVTVESVSVEMVSSGVWISAVSGFWPLQERTKRQRSSIRKRTVIPKKRGVGKRRSGKPVKRLFPEDFEEIP